MKFIRFFSLIQLFFIALSAQAQYNLSADPAKFPQDVTTMLSATKLQHAIDIANNFSAAWGTATDTEKKEIIETAVKMVKSKKLRTNPSFMDFFACMNAFKTKSLPAAQLDTFLLISKKVVEKYDGKQLLNYFANARVFLETGYLYKTNFNSLMVTGGSFSFKYKEPEGESSPVDQYDAALQQGQEQLNGAQGQDVQKAKEDFFSDLDNGQKQDESWGTLQEDTVKQENILDVGYTPPLQPTVDGGFLQLDNVTLTFITQYDSVELKNTSGALLLKNGVFVGKGGTFDWTMAGVPAAELYCELKEYNLPVRSTKLVSEGATLNFPSKTDAPVQGIFEFNSKKHLSVNDAVYPRFKSFASNIHIKGFDHNIIYHGGLSLMGKRVYSSSIDEGYSTIEIQKNGETKIRTIASKFELGDSLISSTISNTTLYLGKDSIFHPGTTFKYNKSNSTLRLTKQGGFKQAPFIDSYHHIEVVVDALEWNLDSAKIDLSIMNAKNEVPALFESDQYFNADKYSSLQGPYRFHPLQMIVGYYEQKKTSEFYAEDIARTFKFDVASIKGAMVYLMKLGFIDYNVKTGHIKLRKKAIHYVLSRRDKKDYDDITFVSISPAGANATLDLITNELIVRGVDKVFISDSLSVYFVPDNKEIKILKNRDFEFNGKINTENFQFIGQNFKFNYDSFLVNLPKIDEIRLAVEEKKEGNTDKGKQKVLGNGLRYSSGVLYINKPNNKSGRKKIPQYPIFNATGGATVFFNKADIAGGAYDTTIKFKIPPFNVDSLSSNDLHAIGFNGEFTSGGIFPDFKEKLVVMPDFSLGFVHATPKDGFPLYTNKGKFYNDIILDNGGIRGDGEIQYLTTTLWSKSFVFYKDSVGTMGTLAKTKEGTHPETTSPDINFADVVVNDYKLNWLISADSMMITNNQAPFELYNNTATLKGSTVVRANGLHGFGLLDTRGSESISPDFHFEKNKFSGRHSIFRVKSDNPSKPAIQTIDAQIDFDLVKKVATFRPEVEGFASTEFPYAQYKTSIGKGSWDMDHKKVTMRMPEGSDISKSYFYSTRLDQDSLVFNATDAVYDITALTLNINGIPYIKVADGKIFPDSNKVVIQENAVMVTLKNAKITLDTVNEYHHLYNGTIDIHGRKKFNGQATYQYVNLGSDTLAIKFEDFKLVQAERKKEGAHTVATALIKESDSLLIAPRVFYKGSVTMYANNKVLSFDGAVKLDLKGALSYSQWLKYVNNGETDEVVLDLQNPRAADGAPLFTGLHFDQSKQIYTTFISQKQKGIDPDIFLAKGSLSYDIDSNEFVIGSKERINKKALQGNVFAYNDSLSIIRYEGTFNYLDPSTSPKVELTAVGTGYALLDSSDFNFNNLLSFKFKVHPSVIEAFGKNLKTASSYMPADSTSEDFSFVELEKEQNELYLKLAQIEGDKALVDFKTKSSIGDFPIPQSFPDLAKGIVLSNIDLKWHRQFKAWYSVGKMQVSNFGKEYINKKLTGYVEFRKTATGDVINLYIETAPDNWYFITYEDNRLGMESSSDEVNTAVKKKSKGELPDRSKFFVVGAEPMEKLRFLKHFKENYLGLPPEAEEYQQYAPSDSVEPSYRPQEEEFRRDSVKTQNEAYQNEEKPVQNENNKESNQVKEEEFNRQKKTHQVKQKQQLQQDQQKMKDLFK